MRTAERWKGKDGAKKWKKNGEVYKEMRVRSSLRGGAMGRVTGKEEDSVTTKLVAQVKAGNEGGAERAVRQDKTALEC